MKFVAALILALLSCQCGGKQLPPNTPGDVGGAVACVLTDVLALQPVDNCIATYGAKLVNDILQMFADSPQLAAEQPEAQKFAAAQAKVHTTDGAKPSPLAP